jgi:hypothetical protein
MDCYRDMIVGNLANARASFDRRWSISSRRDVAALGTFSTLLTKPLTAIRSPQKERTHEQKAVF